MGQAKRRQQLGLMPEKTVKPRNVARMRPYDADYRGLLPLLTVLAIGSKRRGFRC